jgi:hypothetical protein
MSTRSAHGLSKLYEQETALLRERRMAKTFRIQEPGSGGPISMLIRKHTFENQDLLAVRMIVDRECRTRVVTNDGSHLA